MDTPLPRTTSPTIRAFTSGWSERTTAVAVASGVEEFLAPGTPGSADLIEHGE